MKSDLQIGLTCFSFLFYSRNLRKTESRKNKLEDLLNSVGARVNELKEKYVLVLLLMLFTLPVQLLLFVLLSLLVFVFLLVLVF